MPSSAATQAAGFVDTLNNVVIFPTIALLVAVAFLVFIWGCAEYFFNAGNQTARAKGVKHITWGLIGLLIMLSAFTILTIAARTFGVDQQLSCADDPTRPGCDSAFSIPSVNLPGPASGNNTTAPASGNYSTPVSGPQ